MAASVLNAYANITGATVGTRDLTLVAGVGRILVVALVRDAAETLTPTVTFGGVALNEAGKNAVATSQGLWVGYLAVADGASGDVALATSGYTNSLSAIAAVLLQDCGAFNDADVFESAASAGPESTSVTSGSGGIVISWVAPNNSGFASMIATGTDQTEIGDYGVSSSYPLIGSWQPGTGSAVVSTWDWNGTPRVSLVTASFDAPVGGGGGGGINKLIGKFGGKLVGKAA